MSNLLRHLVGIVALAGLVGCTAGQLTRSEYHSLKAKADATAERFKAAGTDPFDGSAGYAVFPGVGKGGFAGITAGFGRGLVYEGGEVVGVSGFNSLNIGVGLGGKVYPQVVFLRSPSDVQAFMDGRWAGAAQADVVAGTWDASAEADFYRNQGLVAREMKGLMFEATVGLQKYFNKPLNEALTTSE